MVVNSIYLGEKGITSTSANFLANLAKEIIKDTEQKLRKLRLYNTNVELINGEKKTLQYNTVELESLETMLNRISSMYSFCAWIREAIKAKEALAEKASRYNIFDYGRDYGVEIPERPDDPKEVTIQDIIDEMSIKERNRYLTIETFAATFGKYIHPDGAIAQAREIFQEKMAEPTYISGNGRDMVIYTYNSSNSIDDVEDTFIALQGKQREYEKQLNALKFKLREEVNKRNSQAQAEFQLAYTEFRSQYAIVNAEAEKVRIKLMEDVSKLRIVIPDDLVDTYNYLETLVK
jgi:hypothetical protein